MVAMINAGGSGTRLWPLSTPSYPKHLLNLYTENENSLLQETYLRAKAITDDIFVVTEAGHAHYIKEQLPQLDDDHIIVEPDRRGTGSCLILALDHISKFHGDNKPVLTMYADHIIHDTNSFVESVKHATDVSVNHRKLVGIGVQPTHPSTGFGYIKKGPRISRPNQRDTHKADGFREKPDVETASKYVHSGEYLWAAGYYVAPISVYVEAMKKNSPALYESYKAYVKAKDKFQAYLDLENMHMESELMITASENGDLLLVPGTFDWADIGNFRDLHDVSKRDSEENAVTGKIEMKDTKGCYVRNDTNMDVAIMGVDDLVVVINKNGILVTKKDKAHEVGCLAKAINDKNMAKQPKNKKIKSKK